MSFKNLFKSLTSTSSRRRSMRGPSSARLSVEALEDRWVPSYSIIDLGPGTGLADINNSGQMVGGMRTADGNYSHAALWQDGVMIDLGTLGGMHSSAGGINDKGQVVGLSYFSNDASAYRAFLLTPEDTDGNGVPDRWFRDTDADGANDLMRDLGTLGGSNANSAADDVNNLGQVVGWSSWQAPEGHTYHAFLWQNGVLTDLGPGGGQNSNAAAINDAGIVTGGIDSAQSPRGFLWKNGTMTDLGESGSGTDINNAGQVVGTWQAQGRLWTPAEPNGTSGTFTYLPTLSPPGEDYYQPITRPAGMNNLGHVVGNSAMEQLGGYYYYVGFVYANGGITELPLDNATAINDAGWIVGNRGDRAYLLTPSPPSPPSPPPTLISISNATVVEGSAGTTDAVFTVSLSAASDQEVTVDYNMGDDTTSVGDDYVPAFGTLRFAAGQTTQTITVAVIGDQMSEPEEYFYVWLSNPSSNAAVNWWSPGVGTIVDDDPPEISVYDASWQEGNTGTNSFTFYLQIPFPSAQTVSVNYTTASGSATAGSDFQPTSGTVTFAPYETSQTITVAVIGDRRPEQDETFFINLSSPMNATIADGQGVGTILDDEPRISITDVTKAEGKNRKTTLFTFTVTLSAAYDQAVTMSFRTVDGTAKTSDSDYIAKTDTLTFAPGQTTKTITIEVKGDSKKESNEYFYLDLFGNSGNSLFTKNRGLGTILNDD